ncbi:hypothetical protein CLOM_g17787 [Closterium sp. NIES-68]|nr:hypothetical protein CLOM_g17787 [Closterium sp. NIES-68]GJP62270.1 hypothetical protein CLOP_g19355 [Closterium sp. NIES-67]
MEVCTNINALPDDILVRILRNSSKTPFESESDAPWPFVNPDLASLCASSTAEKDSCVEYREPFPTPPDAVVTPPTASVCRLWRRLSQRSATKLLVKEDSIVSLQDISTAILSFPHLTHLHLCDGSVETLDDAFLAHLASSCPKLTALHVGRGITQVVSDSWKFEHPITDAGLDHFFRRCTRLEQLSLCCLHHDVTLPPSFFQLAHLHTLVLTDASALDAPGLANLSSLAALHIASRELDYEQLSSLARLPTLTSLSVADQTFLFQSGRRPGAFFIAQLSRLKSLEFMKQCPQFELMFPREYPCHHLERLLITDCDELHHLPDALGEILPCLRQLTIRSCYSLTQLPRNLTSLSCLESLTLSRCSNLSSLPENFGELTALKALVLDQLHLQHLPDSLCQLPSLESLLLLIPRRYIGPQEPDRIVLPEGIGVLTNLRTLVLRNYGGQPLPPSFTQLPSLKRLEVDSCRMEGLVWELQALSNLQQLRIHTCPIRKLPGSLTCLTDLRVLTVGNCASLTSLPRRLHHLARLTQLEVTGCARLAGTFESLPSSLEALSQDSYKRAISLPDLSALQKLRSLTFRLLGGRSGSHQTHVGMVCHRAEGATMGLPLAFLSQLWPLSPRSIREILKHELKAPGAVVQQLRHLAIHHDDRLRELPPALSELQHLTSLEVCHAPKLACLPSPLGCLSQLRKLSVSNCSALEHLPDSLTQLALLHDLDASYTAIRSLPFGLAELSRLRELSLHGCKQLEALPGDLTDLSALLYLGIQGCKQLLDSEGKVQPRSIWNKYRLMIDM